MNAQQPVTIVMIEDDEGHARLIEKNIRRAGISNALRHFTDGGSGLDFLFKDNGGPKLNGPALVLLDLNLPDMPGDQVLLALRDDPALRGIPVVMISGDAIPDQVQRLLKLGADGYLTKPFDLQEFLRVVDGRLQPTAP